MSALETLENILSRDNLIQANLKYCLIDKEKVPYRPDGERVRPNKAEDFVNIDELCVETISDYAGIGVSIQASNICAIDVDHCFKSPFDKESGDERSKDLLNRFKDFAYCEFSFSGTGLRILFRHKVIDNYTKKYYIKNSKNQIEYYQPSEKSFRYVTVTGGKIYDNSLGDCPDSVLYSFLDDYMVRPVRKQEQQKELNESLGLDKLFELVKYFYRSNPHFQEIWFGKAPGSGKDESERDFWLISFIYENITKDKQYIKAIFEESPFFKSKDWKHQNKWEYM